MERVSARLLKGVEWKTRYYRALSHYFSLRWNATGGEEMHRIIQRFEVPADPDEEMGPASPGDPPQYGLLDRGPRARLRYDVLYGEEHWLRLNDIGSAIDNLMWHIQSETFRHSRDYLLIHSGAATTPSGKAVLLPAARESGKTTLTAGLVRAGFGYLSDEAAAIDPVTRRVYPFAKPLTIKEGSFPMFPELRPCGNGYEAGYRWFVQPDEIHPGAVAGPSPIRFVVAPRYRKGATTKLTQITRAQGLVELAENALNFHIYQARALTLLAEALRKASCYRMVVGDLDEAVNLIVELTGKRPRRSGKAAGQPAP